jgi:CheY-like chemotaxis protein
LSNGVAGVYAGVAASDSAGARTLEVLLDEADEALACARYEGRSATIRKDRSADATPPASAQLAPLVLIADDDPDVVRIVDAHLRAAGFRRAIAFDGSRALEEIRAQHPDIIILDLMMPRLTGFDVLAGLRDLEGHRPRTIVLSARGREDDVIRAFSVGADDFMTKPFNPQELLARVGRLVS